MNRKPSDNHWHNRAAWDRLARKQDRLAKPARDEDFSNPLACVDAMGWLDGDVRGKRLLCLAAGGGRQGPIYAAAGAEVTVVDLSPAMLELDREVSHERQLKIRTIEASMDDLSMLDNASFDIVIHPVSTCYVPDVRPVYQEVARITASGEFTLASTSSRPVCKRILKRIREHIASSTATLKKNLCLLSQNPTWFAKMARWNTFIDGKSLLAQCALLVLL